MFLPTPFKLVIDDSVAMTPFYLLLGKHSRQKQENGDRQSSRGPSEGTPQPKGSMGVKEVGVCVTEVRQILVWVFFFLIFILISIFFVCQLLQTPAHVLPSTSVLCSMFVKSLLVSITDPRSVWNLCEIQHI